MVGIYWSPTSNTERKTISSDFRSCIENKIVTMHVRNPQVHSGRMGNGRNIKYTRKENFKKHQKSDGK